MAGRWQVTAYLWTEYEALLEHHAPHARDDELRTAHEVTVTENRTISAQPDDYGRGIDHFAHLRTALGSFVADDDVARDGSPAEDLIFVTVEDTRGPFMNEHFGHHGRTLHQATFEHSSTREGVKENFSK